MHPCSFERASHVSVIRATEDIENSPSYFLCPLYYPLCPDTLKESKSNEEPHKLCGLAREHPLGIYPTWGFEYCFNLCALIRYDCWRKPSLKVPIWIHSQRVDQLQYDWTDKYYLAHPPPAAPPMSQAWWVDEAKFQVSCILYCVGWITVTSMNSLH